MKKVVLIGIFLLSFGLYFSLNSNTIFGCDTCGGRSPGARWCVGNDVVECQTCEGVATCTADGGSPTCWQSGGATCAANCRDAATYRKWTQTIQTCSATETCLNGACVPACTSTNPTAPIINAPSSGSTLYSSTVAVSWSQNGSWGNGCPNVNRYRVYIQPNCTGSFINHSGDLNSSTTNYNLTGLNWNTTYCLRVEKRNGTRTAQANSTFTIGSPGSLSGSNVSGDVCSTGGITGRLGETSTSNPLTFNVSFNKNPASFNFTEVWLSIVPTTGPYAVTASPANAVTVSNNSVAARSITARIITSNNNAQIYQGGWGSTWGSLASTGSIDNSTNTASLINIGTNSITNINGNQVNASFQIEFKNTFPSGTYNVYAMGVLSDGVTTVSTNPTTTSLNMVRLSSWIFDMNSPSSVLNGPTVINPTDFSLEWIANDAQSGLKGVYSYVYSDVDTATIRNLNLGLDHPTTAAVLSYPADAPNAGITASNLGVYSYQDQSPALGAQYTFRLFAEDRACNIAESTQSAQTVPPWPIAYQNSISANGGFNTIRIPNISDFTVPFTTDTGSAFLSTNSVYSGDLNIPQSRVSRNNLYTINYSNDAINLPVDTSFGNWYDYLKGLSLENSKSTIINTNLDSYNITGSLSRFFGISANSKYVIVQNNSVDFNLSNAVCDIKALIFVGGSLNIQPEFTKTSGNGCVFISNGSLTITGGNYKSQTLLSSSVKSSYDIVEAGFIVDTFNSPVDTQAPNQKWDGLYINGFMVNNIQTLQRDLNSTSNNENPAYVFRFDPELYFSFRSDLAKRSYSVREIFD